MDYDLIGRKSTVTHSTGMNSAYSYDDLNRIISITHNGSGEGFSEDLTYDPLTGNISNVVREFGAFAYSNDETDQIASSSYSGSIVLPTEIVNRNFTHDYAGNRTSQGTSSIRNVIVGHEGYASFPDIYGSGRVYQRYVDEQSGWGRENFEYAPDGKLISFEHNLYDKTSVDHVYDPFRRRIAKLINAGGSAYTNSYLHEGLSDKVLIARNGTGTETLFVDGQGVDEHLGQIDTAPKAFVTDHLGSVLNGPNSQNTKSFGAFGERLENVPLLGPAQPALTYAFAGREIEPESKCLYYNRARHFDSCSGRFISDDPVGVEAWGPNLYVYVNNKPLSLIDPSGESPEDVELAGTLARQHYAGSGSVQYAQISMKEIKSQGMNVGNNIYISQELYGWTWPADDKFMNSQVLNTVFHEYTHVKVGPVYNGAAMAEDFVRGGDGSSNFLHGKVWDAGNSLSEKYLNQFTDMKSQPKYWMCK